MEPLDKASYREGTGARLGYDPSFQDALMHDLKASES